MPVLHVIDPALRSVAGHYLSQHAALWHLCRQHGYAMHSYGHAAFDPASLPPGTGFTALFDDTRPNDTIGHFVTDAAQANLQCHDGLSRLDAGRFAAEDLILLTTATIRNVLGYGRWLQDAAAGLACPVGIYCTLSAELDDTVGRALRRDQVALDDDGFDLLDSIVVPNEFKRSAYRYMFRQVPRDRRDRYAVFYEEPFPNRSLMDSLGADGIRFHSLRSMYQGGDHEKAAAASIGRRTIAFLGSGGLAEGEKGWHRIVEIVQQVLAQRDDVRFAIHAGGRMDQAVEQALRDLGRRHDGQDRVDLLFGALDSAAYCAFLERADLVCLPYGERYRHVMSGVFDDCAFLGTVAVVPAASKMARWMDVHNLTPACFQAANPAGIAAALVDVLADFDRHRATFLRAQAIAREGFRRNNPVAVLSAMNPAAGQRDRASA